MKRHWIIISVLGILLCSLTSIAQEVVPFEKAMQLFQSGQTQAAADALRILAEVQPENIEVLTYAGIAVGSLAGEAQQDYMAAGRLALESFGFLDRAVNLDNRHVKARLYRGLMGANVPPFLGRLDQAITDLLMVLSIQTTDPDKVSDEDLVTAHQMLISGYEKKGDPVKAHAVLARLLSLYPEETLPDGISQKIAEYQKLDHDLSTVDIESEVNGLQAQDSDTEANIQKANALIEKGKKQEALDLLKKTAEKDPKNEALYPLILELLSDIVNFGYDETIHEDTDTRSIQAFDIGNWADKAVFAFPDNPQFRIIRGGIGVYMPFFVGKLEQGIEDLEFVLNSDTSDSLKSEALFLLGLAYQRKGLEHWDRVATEFPEENAYQSMLDAMHPPIQKVDANALDKPVLIVDFISAFQDQLAPQIAIWIENARGEFVKTLYVSGFSGHAKEVQVVLPEFANRTGFQDVDGVTGASIDIGEHVMTWDLLDLEGKKVKKGNYTVYVEVSHWPSMKYQVVSSEIQIGKKKASVIKKEGDFLPYVEVTYLPK